MEPLRELDRKANTQHAVELYKAGGPTPELMEYLLDHAIDLDEYVEKTTDGSYG